MKIGLQLRSFAWPGGSRDIARVLGQIATAADAAGFHSLWAMDHFFQIPGEGPLASDMLEGYTMLTYLAGLTKRIKLGMLATGVVYRHPGILVKTATTLDVLCGGRSYFAIGAAWFGDEARGLGAPFPPIRKRFEMLEEALQITKQMWSDNDGPYRGAHYQLEKTLCRPAPLSQPHPPIIVAGSGEKKTLRLVAQYADACNISGTLEVLKAKLAILKRHCDTLGRDYATLEITAVEPAHLAPGKMTPQDVIARCKALADIGVHHTIFFMPNTHEIAPLETFGREIIPAVTPF